MPSITITHHKDLTGTDLHRAASYIQGADPGAVGAGKIWYDTDDDKVYIRNDADSGWTELTGGGAAIDWAEDGDIAAVGTANAANAGTEAAPAGHVHAHEAAHINHDATWAAKGDLIVASANDTASVEPVGANDTILMADSAQTRGVKWAASQTPSTQAFGDAAAEGSADTYSRGDHKHAMPANPKLGSHWIAGGSLTRPTTSPFSAISQLESGTNKQNEVTADFVDGSTTYGEYEFPYPSDMGNGGIFTATFYWRATGTSTNSVRWQVEARSYGDGETIDQAWGTAQAVDDAHTATADQVLISAATGNCTPTGTPAAGEILHVRVARLGGHANDNLAQTVSLIGVRIDYTRV